VKTNARKTRKARAYRRVTPHEAIGITARYEAGEPLDMIAAQHGIGRDTVREIARRGGARMRPVGRPSTAS
jgi:hypothetical protein